MSRYVQNEVAQLRIEASEKVAVSAYFGTDSSAMYFGTAVELGFINENFPPGLVLTQRIKDPENRPLGVVTFFGPKLRNDQVIAPGGFFLMTNISDLLKYYNTNMENDTNNWGPLSDGEADFYINEPYRKKFSSPQQRYKLYKTYKKRGKKAGMID